ncbi:hypothetical protein [Leeia oryzae]|uniref:hypothetical protein n=1 Tax=Leeia oryzae TaxID=356662 RepID=UPI0003998A51|nr:hypothetical protein [Leeia oryzae]
MLVKVFEQANNSQIVLLMREEFEFRDVGLQDIPPPEDWVLQGTYPEESLFYAGVDVSLALPDLIQFGYHLCQG